MHVAPIRRVSLDELARLPADQLQRAAAKLTHVGEQTEPVLTVLIHTYGWLPSLDVFACLSTSGLSYANDTLPAMVCISTAPAEFAGLMAAAIPVVAGAGHGPPSLSFSAVIDAPAGRSGNEWLLSEADGIALAQALLHALRSDNGVGREALSLQYGAVGDHAP
jgi:hypothetical protein